jgi:hypothetical protein
MADATHDTNRHPAPTGWHDAFAALPQEAPTTSRWAAIDAALIHADDGTNDDRVDDAGDRTRTMPWPRRIAWAAVLAAIALPAMLWLRPDTGSAPSRTPFTTAPAPAASSSVVAVAPAAEASAAAPASTAVSTPAPQPSIRPNTARIARTPDAGTRQRAPAAQAKPWPRARIATGHDDSASLQAAFEPYYAEAARLERVIAATRDPRVGSGPGASLAGALDAELAGIDARLARPGLDAGQRLALWRERVDLLRASAEFESQLRLLAVEGDALDGALVRID